MAKKPLNTRWSLCFGARVSARSQNFYAALLRRLHKISVTSLLRRLPRRSAKPKDSVVIYLLYYRDGMVECAGGLELTYIKGINLTFYSVMRSVLLINLICNL